MRGKRFLSKNFRDLCTPYSLKRDQKVLLAAMLREKGYEID